MEKLNSYTDFLDKAKAFALADIGIEQWHTQIEQGKYYRYYREAKPGIYVLDFTTQNYLYCNEVMASYADYSIPDLMRGGLRLALKLWHPDDLKVYDQHILPDNLAFLDNKTVANYGNYLFTCNYRVRNQKGRYIRIEQTSFFSKSVENGMPIMTIGFLRDITNRMIDNTIIHTIEEITGQGNKLLHRSIHNPDTTVGVLTTREEQILELIIKGKNSAEIAKLLGIEKNTVDNHRKNMLTKTNSQNMVQLAIKVYKTSMAHNLITD